LPNSLMQRLALLECGVFPVSGPRRDAGVLAVSAKSRLSRFGASFGLGVLGGGALGLATLVVVLAHPGKIHSQSAAFAPDGGASLIAAASSPGPESERAIVEQLPTPALQLTMRRSDAAGALFPLQVSGVEAMGGVSIVLRELPETARLSAGERQEAGAWLLRPADLEGLRLALADGTPDTFDMTIEVTSPTGTLLAKAIAHVRLLDPPDAATLAEKVAAASIEDILAASQPAPQASEVDTPFRTEVTIAPRVSASPVRRAEPRPDTSVDLNAKVAADDPGVTTRGRRPDGVNALGGPATVASPPATEVRRQVWWRMPQPAWTPYGNGLGPN
jgi:hypothetical protein